jgi:hypothetical protein
MTILLVRSVPPPGKPGIARTGATAATWNGSTSVPPFSWPESTREYRFLDSWTQPSSTGAGGAFCTIAAFAAAE